MDFQYIDSHVADVFEWIKRTCPAEHNEYWVVDAEPNAIMPLPPDGQWAPGTVDGPIGLFLLPLGGSAEVARKFYFLITATVRPYSGLGLPTTKHEKMLDLSTLSYKKRT